jgi:hypothetical protein
MKNATTTAPKAAKKLSQLDAAVKVLAKAKGPMNCQQLVEAMAKRKLWVSPKGKTPHLTLSAALQREVKTKGEASRFVKAGPGLYALKD